MYDYCPGNRLTVFEQASPELWQGMVGWKLGDSNLGQIQNHLLKSGKIMADFKSEGNSENCRDMLKTAIMWAAAFRNMGSRPSRPADLLLFSLVSSSWTSEVERGVKPLLDGEG